MVSCSVIDDRLSKANLTGYSDVVPALTSITVEGFKSIASVKLSLRPINILIGSNGSGKSNFIEVFELSQVLRKAMHDKKQLQNYVGKAGGANKILHFGAKTTPLISIRLVFENQYNMWFEVASTQDDSLYISKNIDSAWEVEDRPGEWQIYHFEDTSPSSALRRTARVDDNRFLRADGSNLASFLYFLKKKHPLSYGLIRQTIQRVAPFFDDFELEPLWLNEEDIKLQWRHKNSDQYFNASSLSDGTLRFISLAALFLQPAEFLPSVILVDEPELGLHPYAIEMLASLIRQASKSAQVIVSTQSPLLLDYFSPEDILVANRVNGATQIERLDPAPLAVWLQDYSLGQLWEKNEIKGRPTPE